MILVSPGDRLRNNMLKGMKSKVSEASVIRSQWPSWRLSVCRPEAGRGAEETEKEW